MSVSGSGCGDLDATAAGQRLDGSGCSGYFESDGNGVYGQVTFDATGNLPATDLTLGTGTASCTGTSSGGTIQLSCSGDAGACSITMTFAGSL